MFPLGFLSAKWRESSDADVVGAPGDDCGFDGLLVEVFREGFDDECGEFGVGSKAQTDELLDRKGVDVRVRGERGDAESLFEADHAVLHAESVKANLDGHNKQPER